MVLSRIDSAFLRYLLANGHTAGDRLPSLSTISAETGMSMGKLREQFEVARMLGLVEASPRRGIFRTAYDFLPASAPEPADRTGHRSTHLCTPSAACGSTSRHPTGRRRWVCSLARTSSACANWSIRPGTKLNLPRIQIPLQEHRELHLTIYRRLNNPFVVALLEAYWDAYEAVELHTFADLGYLQAVWRYHERIVDAICAGETAEGKRLLVEHMKLLSARGTSMEVPAERRRGGAGGEWRVASGEWRHGTQR